MADAVNGYEWYAIVRRLMVIEGMAGQCPECDGPIVVGSLAAEVSGHPGGRFICERCADGR